MAVEVEKLYGIVHGAKVGYLWVESEVYLKPSRELLDELSRLPPKTSVGIEEYPPEERAALENLVIEGVETNPGGVGHYWESIIKCCHTAGLKLIFLEDNSSLYKESSTFQVRASKLEKRLKRIKNPDKRNQLKAEIYAFETEAEFIRIVRREESLLRRIEKTKPRVVLLGRGHADYLWLKPELAEKYGIKFKAYAAEEIPDLEILKSKLSFCISEETGGSTWQLAEFLSRDIPPNPFTQNPVIDKLVLAERNSIERRYREVKTGRITDGNPDYIGMGPPYIPAEDQFELF